MKMIRHVSSNGSALVITLAILTLLSIVLLAVFINVQLSEQLSRSRSDGFAAHQFAQDGVEQAVALLKYVNADTNTFWNSSPGQFIGYASGSNSQIISVSSGMATNGVDGVNLNAPLVQDPSQGFIFFSSNVSIPAHWIYIRADGTRSAASGYDATNPIVGRYAFWMDDESTKMNVNTAWARSTANTNANGHPSKISLSTMFTVDAEATANGVNDYRKTNLINSRLDILKAIPGASSNYIHDVDRAKEWTTFFNSAPSGYTYFGAPKIVLTTKESLSGGSPYLNVSNNTALVQTVNKMIDYMGRSDWPIGNGHSFQEKFNSGNKGRLAQIALNIIDYVRAKESSPDARAQNMIPPTSGSVDPSGVFNKDGNFNRDRYRTFLGINRALKITEIGVWRNKTLPYGARIFLTVYLPPHYGIDQIDLTKLWRRPLEFQINPFGGSYLSGQVAITAADVSPSILTAGHYARIRIPLFLFKSGSPVPGNGDETTQSFVRRPVALLVPYATDWSPNDYVQVAQVPFQNDAISLPITESVPIPGGNVPDESLIINTIRIDDPALGGVEANWKPAQTAISNMGHSNPRSTVGTSQAQAVLEQDIDSSGKITDAGMVMPPPAGQNGNVKGVVESIGELGYIHTGVHPDEADANSNVPWRTIRLQPRSRQASLDSLPDWALLDLFDLPKIGGGTNWILYPNVASRGGLMNINAQIEPFTNVTRYQALMSLFRGVTNIASTSLQDQTATNVFGHILASNSFSDGRRYGTNDVFTFPGEITEIKGVSDTGENSEALVREIIDLVVTRSNTFSIFSAGQAVKQLPDGRIIVKGESRQMQIVERFKDSGLDKFRTLFSKEFGY